MKPCTYCGCQNEDGAIRCRECGTQFTDPSPRRNAQASRSAGVESLTGIFSDLVPDLKLRRRWLVCFLGLVVLAVASALLLSHGGRKTNAPGIVVLATWYSNGEQLVTFRPEPPSAEITYVDLISVSDDENAQPATVRSFGRVFPIRNGRETNYSLHFVALPTPRASIRGRPLTYTPGSYTVAYTPTENAHRVRAGVAFEQKGIGDYVGRLRNCLQQKTLATLMRKSYGEPTFVTLKPITNAIPRTQ
jgi:hypothetical protein